MSAYHTVWFRIGASAAALIMIAGLTLVTTTVLGLTFQGSERKEGLLLTANRDRLAICIQAVEIPPVDIPAAIQAEAKLGVESLLPELEKHRNWARAGLASAAPLVDIGCPSDPALLRPGADVEGGAPGSTVKEASPYRLFVFILPQAEIDKLFAGWPYRRVPQEFLCVGHVCPEVTTGVYVSLEELKSKSFLQDELAKGIGLEPAVPLGAESSQASLVTMALDTDTTGNAYTANPNFPVDTNNQDNMLVSTTVEPCSLLALPALGASSTRNADVLLKTSSNTIAADIRLILKDTGGAVISPNFAEIVSFNATPFSDQTQDTDLDGDPPPASGGTGTDPAQPVGFLNLPVEPSTVGSLLPGSQGGKHRALTFASQPGTIPPNTVNAFASAAYNGSRDLHASADHPHDGTEVENGATAPYVSNSTNGATVFRATIRVKNLVGGANGTPFFMRLDLAATDAQPGAAVVIGNDTNADNDFNDDGEEQNNPLPEGNLADGGLQVGGIPPAPCP